MTSFVSFF